MFKVTPVTATVTVTVQVAVLFPSTVLTVMVAEPPPTAVTLPLASTVATEVLELVHVTFLFVASLGVIVAVSVCVDPFVKDMLVLFRLTPVTGTDTVTVQVAVLFPSAVFTVMVAEPPPTAVTLPLASTVATEVLELVHVTFLFVASLGVIVAVNVCVDPFVKDMLVMFRLTPVTGTVTVTAQVAVLLPSAVLTVMVAEPPATAVTLPLASTVATEVLELVQVTFLFVASLGVIVAIRVSVEPFAKDRLVLFRLTPVTGTVTVTAQVAVLLPSAVFTVMVAEPPANAVTLPFESTVATEVFELVHVTLLFLASLGVIVAVNVSVDPFASERLVLFRLTPVTGTVTVTEQVADFPPATAVIVADPPPTAVTLPFESTVATEAFELAQATV